MLDAGWRWADAFAEYFAGFCWASAVLPIAATILALGFTLRMIFHTYFAQDIISVHALCLFRLSTAKSTRLNTR